MQLKERPTVIKKRKQIETMILWLIKDHTADELAFPLALDLYHNITHAAKWSLLSHIITMEVVANNEKT